MKKIVLLSIVVFLFSTCIYGAQKIVLATGEWEPYTSEKMKDQGFFTEIVTAVFKELNIEVEYKFLPWKRCEDMATKGDVFAAFPYMITEERKKTFDFTDTVAKSTGKFFYHKGGNIKDGFNWNSYADLKSYKVGGTLGYWYEKDFQAAGLNTEFVPNEDSSFKKLQMNRIDLAASDELVGWQLIKSLFPKEVSNFDTLDKPLNESELCLMVSKAYPDSKNLTEKFNTGLKKIKEKGIYSAILKKYNIK